MVLEALIFNTEQVSVLLQQKMNFVNQLARMLSIVNFERVPPPKDGKASIVAVIIKVLAALLMRQSAQTQIYDFEPVVALIGLMRHKERIWGSALD